MNDIQKIWQWLYEHKVIPSADTNPHKAQRYKPYVFNPSDLEDMPKEMIETIIRLAIHSPDEDPSLVLSEILEGKRKLPLGLPWLRY